MERRSVLVVEDDPELREALTASLLSEGFDALGVATGEAAMEVLSQKTFEAVCLDVILPDLSGYEICEWIRRGGRDAWVVMMSARAYPADEANALEAGADLFLAKPFPLKVLLEALGRVKGTALRNAVA
jgi:DNA-binding response OmpR family regulator